MTSTRVAPWTIWKSTYLGRHKQTATSGQANRLNQLTNIHGQCMFSDTHGKEYHIK